MHFCCLVFTNEFPSDYIIAKQLAPFSEEDFYNKYEKEIDEDINFVIPEPFPKIMWDWYQIGGRYAGSLRMKIDKDDEDYKWGFILKDSRVNRLYRNIMLEEITGTYKKLKPWKKLFAESEFLPYLLGDNEDSYRMDGCETRLVINKDLSGFYMIRANGEPCIREKWNDDGSITKNENYEKEVADEFEKAKYVCVVDLHD